MFAKIGFRSEDAERISIIELLDYPTTGRNQLSQEDLSGSHLLMIRHVIFKGKARFIFLSAGVQRLLDKTKRFSELSGVKRDFRNLKVLYEDDDRAVFLHPHFSNFGKFEQQLHSEARAIYSLLPSSDA